MVEEVGDTDVWLKDKLTQARVESEGEGGEGERGAASTALTAEPIGSVLAL